MKLGPSTGVALRFRPSDGKFDSFTDHMGIFNKRVWDTSKQTYFIDRKTTPWKVVNLQGEKIADYPTFVYNADLEESVCFAVSDEAVVKILLQRQSKL